MGNHGAARVSQNADVLVVLVAFIPNNKQFSFCFDIDYFKVFVSQGLLLLYGFFSFRYRKHLLYFSHRILWNSLYAAWVSDLLVTETHSTNCISLTNLLILHCLISRINLVVEVFIASYLIFPSIHWNGNVFILMKFSSLAALEVVKMTTSSAASD